MEGAVSKIITLLTLILHLRNVDSFSPAPRAKLVSYRIPEKRAFKKALGYNEDSYLNFTELTSKYNFPTEEHSVTTDDGYILAVFRILPKCQPTRGFPIVLMHGIYDSSDEYIVTGPNSGLGYILSNNCYDVWAANHRGNVYSRRHVSLDPDKDVEFWNYSFDEHGYFDIPAIVDYVIKQTRQPKVNYIGHSQGTTDFLVMGSLKPEYNERVHISFQLAPISWLNHLTSPVPKIAAPFTNLIKLFLDEAGLRELLGRHQIIHFIVEFLCQFAPEEICGTILTLTTGYRRGNISPQNLAVGFGHLLAGISSKELAHFGQIVNTGRFQRYDEGRRGNLRRYGVPKPPEYNVSLVTAGVVLLCSKNDWLSSLTDIDFLRSKLPNVIEYYVVPDPSFSHNDLVYGTKAPEYVFPKILGLLNRNP